MKQNHLRYAGRVGTGFDNKTAVMLKEKLSQLAVEKTPLFEMPGDVKADLVNWVVPELVAEVSFAEWTKEGRLRHAVFHGLRNDKPAALITRETPQGRRAQQRTVKAAPARTINRMPPEALEHANQQSGQNN